jgi:outer membrane protein assembly factor BamB
LAAVVTAGVGVLAAGCQDWSGYLFGATHSSDNGATTYVTKANAPSLSNVWNFTPPGDQGGVLYSSPTVYNGQVYIGSGNGTFYDLNESTGAVVWSHFTAQQTSTTCPGPPLGFVSTATVATDPVSGAATVYVAAPDGYLYAWDASTGALRWQSVVAIPSTTQNDYFNWSSPTVANGKIYVGVSSNCDNPLVSAGEKAYDQGTGALLATFTTIPNDIGGSIWSSAMVANDGSVYVTTGNRNEPNGAFGDSESIVRLDGTTLQQKDIYSLPQPQFIDADFGGSVTSWTATINGVATPMIGACNKNGNYYALKAADLAAGPVWTDHVGSISRDDTDCIAAAVWDQASGHLFLAGNDTTIGGTPYTGSIEEVNPATGAKVWQQGLPGAVMGSPTLNGSGVLAVGTNDYSGIPDAAYLLDASNGQVLTTINSGGVQVFAQPVFANNYLFVATAGQGLWAYQPSAISTRILKPMDDDTVSGSTILDASASANATSVSFYVTGGSLNHALVATGASSAFGWFSTWDTTGVPDGSYLVQSVATDSAGDSSQSPPVGFTIANSTPTMAPVVPKAGASAPTALG